MSELLVFLGHHPFLAGALGVAVVLFIANEAYGSLTQGPRVTVPEAVRMINDGTPRIVDVRSQADYKKGHLLGAVNIPAQQLVRTDGAELGAKDRPVILYCALGGLARETAQGLRKAGFTQIFPLKGGLNEWLTHDQQVTVK